MANLGAKTYTCMNRFINVTLFYYADNDNLKAIVLECPLYGIKPDIKVEVSELPGFVSYGLTVTIKNMNIDVDITQCAYMRVEMGYETYGKACYDSQIFYTARETPNPDGVTVIKGIVVGYNSGNIAFNSPRQYLDMLKRDEMVIDVESGMTFEGLLNAILKPAGTEGKSMWFDLAPSEGLVSVSKLLKEQCQLEVAKLHFNNANERITYAMRLVRNYTSKHQEYSAIVTVVNGNVLYIYDMAEKINPLTDMVYITGYNSAIYNGALLTLNMPYLPTVHPGTKLSCDINYYQAEGTPTPKSRNLRKRYFYVLKLSVTFSTVEDNSMSIVAQPGDLIPKEEAEAIVIKTEGYLPVECREGQNKQKISDFIGKAKKWKWLTNGAPTVEFKGDSTAFMNAVKNHQGYQGIALQFTNGSGSFIPIEPNLFYPIVILGTYIKGVEQSSDVNEFVRIDSLYATSISSEGNLVFPSPTILNAHKSEAKELYEIYRDYLTDAGGDIGMFDLIAKGMEGTASFINVEEDR